MDQASRSRKPRKVSWAIQSLSGQRALSVIAAVLVAVATLVPQRVEHQIPILADRQQLGPEFSQVLTLLLMGLLAVTVIGVVWKSQLARRLRMSWPLLLVGVLYLVGLAALASSTVRQALFALVSGGVGGWLRQATAELDAEHAVTYVAFMIIVAFAWREKVALWWIALGLFAYSYVLELLQQLVPGREYSLGDLAANGLGIAIALVGILLFDLLTDRKTPPADIHEDRRRRRVRRASHSTSRPSRRSTRAGLMTSLGGALIALASLLAGSVAELRFTQVFWQIFTQFSAAYVFTFWLGVLVMVVGWLRTRGMFGSRGRGGRVRTARLR